MLGLPLFDPGPMDFVLHEADRAGRLCGPVGRHIAWLVQREAARQGLLEPLLVPFAEGPLVPAGRWVGKSQVEGHRVVLGGEELQHIWQHHIAVIIGEQHPLVWPATDVGMVQGGDPAVVSGVVPSPVHMGLARVVLEGVCGEGLCGLIAIEKVLHPIQPRLLELLQLAVPLLIADHDHTNVVVCQRPRGVSLACGSAHKVLKPRRFRDLRLMMHLHGMICNLLIICLSTIFLSTINQGYHFLGLILVRATSLSKDRGRGRPHGMARHKQTNNDEGHQEIPDELCLHPIR
mmetsp:Transcript_17275/g.30829  ORF Transcript_17275/g.30829 Transcript_17275/m.30829 type:complete len:290 (+) Transcript_17275:1077-1946(+)